MLNRYKNIIAVLAFTLLMGCQTATNEPLFMPAPNNNDKSITTAVLETMLLNEDLSGLNVHVQTIDGVVSLSGYVKTIRQSDTSEDIARKTPGVKSVQNNIIVRK